VEFAEDTLTFKFPKLKRPKYTVGIWLELLRSSRNRDSNVSSDYLVYKNYQQHNSKKKLATFKVEALTFANAQNRLK